MPAEIIITGLEAILGSLDQFGQIVIPELEQATHASLKLLSDELSNYPPPLPASTYRRTVTLGRNWTETTPVFIPQSTGFEGRTGNNTPYATYVQGKQQAKVHKDRWKTVDKTIADNLRDIEALFQLAANRIVERIEGR